MAQWVWGNVTLWQRMLRWVGIDRLNMSGRGGVQLKLQTTVRAPDFTPETCVFLCKLHVNHKQYMKNTCGKYGPVFIKTEAGSRWSVSHRVLSNETDAERRGTGKWCSRQSWGQSSGPGYSHFIFNFYRGTHNHRPQAPQITQVNPHTGMNHG